MQFWACPDCGEKIFGSLDVVLLLASAHRCHVRVLPRPRETRCLDCLRSPTGLCAYHARQATLRALMPPAVAPWWNVTMSQDSWTLVAPIAVTPHG